MNPELLRGHLDLILLSVLEHDPMYGFEIIKEIQARSGGYFDLKEGTLYPALHRLTGAGYLETDERELGRNGRPRRYYTLTARGHQALAAKRREWAEFGEAVASVGRTS